MPDHESSPGRRFREALAAERPLQLVGAINAYTAMLAAQAGFRALYLSGAGVANASFGRPDVGLTTLGDVREDARRILAACELPLLVDADTGFEDVAECVRTLERVGAAGLHIEDQADSAKRCGHLPGKQLVAAEVMCQRIDAAIVARADASFVLMARTDAASVEGLDGAIRRARRYIDAGADMIFAEALTSLDEMSAFVSEMSVPVLVNLTEFGRTPLLTLDDVRRTGAAMALYPLTAFRAMSAAATRTYRRLREDGTQAGVLDQLQTRAELYRVLGYAPAAVPATPSSSARSTSPSKAALEADHA